MPLAPSRLNTATFGVGGVDRALGDDAGEPGVGGDDQAVHRRRDVGRREVAAVLPLDALAQLERPDGAVLVGLPRLGETGGELAVLAERDEELEALGDQPVGAEVLHGDRVERGGRRLVGDPDDAALLAGARRAGAPSCRVPGVPGARRRAVVPVPARAASRRRRRRRTPRCTAPMNGIDSPMIVPRRMKLRRLILPLGVGLDEVEVNRSDGATTRSKRFQSMGSSPGGCCGNDDASPLAGRTLMSGRRCGATECSRYGCPVNPVSAITRIEISHHRLPLDPPFPASWDPRPRTALPGDDRARRTTTPATSASARATRCTGSPTTSAYFIGEDPLDLDRHDAVLANIDFHAGRPWPLDVALWDLAGQITDRPLWDLVGGRDRRRAGVRLVGRAPPGRRHGRAGAGRCATLGFPALKVRFGRPDLADDLAVVRAIRDAVGDALELMVDCNQGWRMPWDVRPPWDVDRATDGRQRAWRPRRSTGSRSRCTAATTTGWPSCAGGSTSASPAAS